MSDSVTVTVPQLPTVQAAAVVLPSVMVTADSAATTDMPIAQVTAYESLSGDDFVTFTTNGLVRADASDSARPAHGYVRQATNAGATALVYASGRISRSALTAGAQYFLATGDPGKFGTSTSGVLVQRVGVASNDTTLSVQIHQPVTQLPVAIYVPPGTPSDEPPIFTAP